MRHPLPLLLVACVEAVTPGAPVSVHVRPAAPLDGEALTCEVEGALATVRARQWRRDGAPWGDAATPVPWGEARFGERWDCEVAWVDGAGAGTVAASAWVAEAPRPNLLLVVLDDVGVDQVRAYGARPGQAVTPTLDALAADGVRFETAWGMPVCSPARAALLTGRVPRRYGIGTFIDSGGSAAALPLAEQTLPELLRGAPEGPYATAFAGKWHLAGRLSPGVLTHPVDQGFDAARFTVGNLGTPSGEDGGVDYFTFPRVVDGVEADVSGYATSVVVDDALALLDGRPEPWLVMVALHAVHRPLHRPPARLLRTDPGPDPGEEALVVSMLEAADTELGRLLDGLGDARQRTVVIVAGDNGAAASAQGEVDTDEAGLKGTLFEGGVRVPLLVSGPGVVAPGRSSEALVSLLDVVPTVLGLGGVHLRDLPLLPGGVPGGVPAIDGASFLRALLDPDWAGDRTFLQAERFLPNGPPPWPLDVRAIRDRHFKLVRGPRTGDQLYRLDGGVEGEDLLAAPLDADAAEAFIALDTADRGLRTWQRWAYR